MENSVTRNKFQIRINKESKLQFLLIYFWIAPSIVSYGIVFLSRLTGISDEFAHVIINTITVLVVLFSLDAVVKQLRFRHIIFYFAILMVFLISYQLFPLNRFYIEEYFFTFFVTVLPYFFLGCMLDKVRIPYQTLLVLSRIVIVLYLVVFLFFSVTETGDHDMGKAYNCLPSIMLVSYSALKNRKTEDMAFMLLGAVFLLICATRGPILLYAIFMLLMGSFLSVKRRFLYWALIVITVLLWLSPLGLYMIRGLLSVMSKAGFSTRIFELLLAGDLTYDNGRDWLTRAAFDMIEQNPLWGNGIFSSYRATEGITMLRGSSSGIYVHNILYEWWCDFGYVFGTLLLLILGIWIIKSLRKETIDYNLKLLLLIFTLCYVIKLFMSSSYIYEQGFWVCIGICFEGRRSCRRTHIRLFRNSA